MLRCPPALRMYQLYRLSAACCPQDTHIQPDIYLCARRESHCETWKYMYLRNLSLPCIDVVENSRTSQLHGFHFDKIYNTSCLWMNSEVTFGCTLSIGLMIKMLWLARQGYEKIWFLHRTLNKAPIEVGTCPHRGDYHSWPNTLPGIKELLPFLHKYQFQA